MKWEVGRIELVHSKYYYHWMLLLDGSAKDTRSQNFAGYPSPRVAKLVNIWELPGATCGESLPETEFPTGERELRGRAVIAGVCYCLRPEPSHAWTSRGGLFNDLVYELPVFSDWVGSWCFADSSVGKEPPAMQETLVRFLGREDPLEKG